MGMLLRSAIGALAPIVVVIATFSLLTKPEYRALALLCLGYLSLGLAHAGQDPTERKAWRISRQTECPLPVARARAVAELGAGT